MAYKNQHTIRLDEDVENELIKRTKRSKRSLNAEIEFSLNEYLFGDDQTTKSKLSQIQSLLDQVYSEIDN